MSIDYFKKQAKSAKPLIQDLLEHPPETFTLARAQALVARMHGYADWHSLAARQAAETKPRKPWALMKIRWRKGDDEFVDEVSCEVHGDVLSALDGVAAILCDFNLREAEPVRPGSLSIQEGKWFQFANADETSCVLVYHGMAEILHIELYPLAADMRLPPAKRLPAPAIDWASLYLDADTDVSYFFEHGQWVIDAILDSCWKFRSGMINEPLGLIAEKNLAEARAAAIQTNPDSPEIPVSGWYLGNWLIRLKYETKSHQVILTVANATSDKHLPEFWSSLQTAGLVCAEDDNRWFLVSRDKPGGWPFLLAYRGSIPAEHLRAWCVRCGIGFVFEDVALPFQPLWTGEVQVQFKQWLEDNYPQYLPPA